MPATSKKQKTTVTIDADLHERVRLKTVAERTSMAQIVVAAFEAYVGEKKAKRARGRRTVRVPHVA